MVLKDLQHIRYKRFIFSAEEYFLAENIRADADITYCIQCSETNGNTLEEFYTLLIDLSQPEETIRAGIYHRTLSEINSFTGNQHFEHKMLLEPSEADLREFTALFDAFAKEKKIRKAERFRLSAYRKHGILAISYIRQNDKILCVNFYRLTKKRAANISSFRVKEQGEPAHNSSHLGRAHRALHWLDILAFKKGGVAYYDFCGWYPGTENKELLNINAFKEQFTQYKVKEYSGVIYKHKVLLFLRKLLK